MRALPLFLLIGVLCAGVSAPDSNPDPIVTTSTTEISATTKVPKVEGSSTAASTKMPDPEGSTGRSTHSSPTEATVTGGSSHGPITQPADHSVSTTAPNAPTTGGEAGSTPAQPASTTPTTLPPVTVLKAGVQMKCNNSRCSYTLQVPQLSKTFLTDQQSIFSVNEVVVATEETRVSELENNDVLSDAKRRFDEIKAAVDQAQAKIEAIRAALVQIKANMKNVTDQTYTISKAIDLIRADTGTCLYEQCLAPSTPSPTTPPTTTPPTTTPDPCANPDVCLGQGQCSNKQGSAACQCYGNLDGTTANVPMCITSKCNAPGTSPIQKVQSFGNGSYAVTYFVSPGWGFEDRPNFNNTQYNSSMNCEWQIQLDSADVCLQFKNTTGALKPFETMDSTARIVYNNGGDTYTLSSLTSWAKANGGLKAFGTTNLNMFTFTSGNVDLVKPYYFMLQFDVVKRSSITEAELKALIEE